MPDLAGVVVNDGATERVAADFFQRSGDAGGIARELDGRGVGEEFALARDGGLDHAAEKIPHIADEKQGQADGADEHDGAAFVAVAPRAPGRT